MVDITTMDTIMVGTGTVDTAAVTTEGMGVDTVAMEATVEGMEAMEDQVSTAAMVEATACRMEAEGSMVAPASMEDSVAQECQEEVFTSRADDHLTDNDETARRPRHRAAPITRASHNQKRQQGRSARRCRAGIGAMR
jgi:hypothetical protein